MFRLVRAIRNEQSVLFTLALLIGIAVGAGVIGFRLLIRSVQLVCYGSGSQVDFATLVATLPVWHVLLVPTLGGLIIGLFVHYLMPEQRNYGVADIIEACALRAGRMSTRAGIGAALAAATSIGMGASVGREGPAVHLGASLSAWVAKRLRLDRGLSLTLVGCGGAAAVAASFNAPIAGVFFALEVIVGHYALNAFAPIVISSVSATVVAQSYFGDRPAFLDVPNYYYVISPAEMPIFALLGVVCAVVASIFMASTILVQKRMSGIALPAWARPAVGGLVVGVIALAFPQILGVGYQATDLAMRELLPLTLLLALVLAKMIATVVSLGSGFAGGVFSPALFIGAMTGGAFGLIAASVAPGYVSTHGVYTLVGMAGVAAAVLGAPVSTILVVFELTSNYRLIIAAMIVVVVASMLSQRLTRKSFFVWQLEQRGIDLRTARETGLLLTMTVGNLISDDHAVVPAQCKLADLQSVLSGRPRALLVVDEEGRLSGRLMLADILRATLEPEGMLRTAADTMRSCDTTILPSTSLAQALELAGASDADYLPVVDDPEQRHVLGVVYHKDLVLMHNKALLAARAAERGDH
jgi:chloride channel protein, CIC family